VLDYQDVQVRHEREVVAMDRRAPRQLLDARGQRAVQPALEVERLRGRSRTWQGGDLHCPSYRLW